MSQSTLPASNSNGNKTAYGPHNPHPLLTMKTELVWEGKYDEYGQRREVDVAGCAMPMQRIETIDEPRREAIAEGKLALFEKQVKGLKTDDFRNRLIWGDNKLVMASLLKEFKGKLDLIYIDPPFDVGADFTMDVPFGKEDETVEKDQSILEMVAYRDTWGRGTDSYLHMMYERLILMRELLSERGSIFVHCDQRANALLRCILDEVFGSEQFHNEIARIKCNPKNYTSKTFGYLHDTLFFYARASKPIFNEVREQRTKAELEEDFPKVEAGTGRRYTTGALHAPGIRQGSTGGPWRGLMPPTGRHWAFVPGTLDEMDKQGLVEWSDSGNPRGKQYADEDDGRAIQSIWDMKDPGYRQAGYVTQKPEPLLARIISACSNEGDCVADFFCGGGTTGAVAERLNRRWLMCDLGRFAIHTTRKRLIESQRSLHAEGNPYRAFDVYNLGRYERQWWQKERLHGAEEEHRRVVLEFFRAEVLTGALSSLLHGRKGGALCHVDGIDSIFERSEATAVAKAVAKAGGEECYCLAWEFEMDLALHTAALERDTGVKLKLIQIPREIMEKNRKSPPPFLEVALLEAEAIVKGRGPLAVVEIKLKKFMPSLAEVPSAELEAIQKRAVKSGMDFIDFWAVDFDWRPGKAFNHHWQDYRTRKDRSLKTVSDAGYQYPSSGRFTACVKVVDTFGCDTSVTVEVRV